MDTKMLARLLNAGRIVVGIAMIAAPAEIAPRMLGRIGRKPGTHFMMRLFGVRDLVLGAGTLASIGKEGERMWLLAGLAADAVDLASTVAAADDLPQSTVVSTIAAAGGAVVIGAGVLASDSQS